MPHAAALAEDIDTNPTPSELQRRVEESAAAYDEAVAEVEALEADIRENAEQISQLEDKLPAQRERSSAAARELYKMQNQQFSFVEFLLAAEDLHEFLRMFEYATHVTDSSYQEMGRLQTMMDELQASREQLERDKAAADEKASQAEKALQEAQAARLEAQRKAEEEARRRAEEAAAAAAAAQRAAEAKAAAEAQAAQNANHEDDEDYAGGTPVNGGSESYTYTVLTPDGANWAVTEEEFVAAWAPRIDAYLSGWPLAGQGATFAKAAWDYGIDPRFSPAISCVESSKGSACFLPHNAWGWGSISWDSWEEAINDHVRGLARGYGYTVTPEGAAKYCPPNASFWYQRVVQEMNLI